MLRLKLVIAIGTIALFVFGGWEVYKGIKFGTQVSMTYDQFIQKHPTEGWFKITGARMSLLKAVHETKDEKNDKAKIKKVYVPIVNDEEIAQEDKAKIKLLIMSEKEETVAKVGSADTDSASDPSLKEGAKISDEKATKILEKYFPTAVIEGMVKSGLDSEESERTKQLAAAIPNRAEDCIILEEGKRPSLGVGIFLVLLAAGLTVAQVLYYLMYRRR